MADHLTEGKDNADFSEFMSTHEMAPPRIISDQILSKVHCDLHPSIGWVFSKVGLIHLITGLMTLGVCPQFGLGWTDLSFRFFDHLGGHHSTLCTLTCGAIFLGSGSLVASWILRPEELRVVRRFGYLYYPVYALLTLAVFLSLNTHSHSFVQTIVWLTSGLGAMALVMLLMVPLRMRLLPTGIRVV